jgi:hypothetical protein
MEPETTKPYPKLYPIFNGLSRFIVLIVLFSNFSYKFRSFYWEAGKMVVLLIIIVGLLVLEQLRNKRSWPRVVGIVVIYAALCGLVGWDSVDQYKHNLILDNLGKDFNPRRRALGLPVIPAGWYIKNRDRHSTDWRGNDTTGHYWKMTMVDSTYTLDFEEDEYQLKAGGDIMIQARFSKGNKLDSISYSYEEGSNSRPITHQQADSIFAAEKIQKDY